ncbi:MAG: hypothetical protein QM756_15195 [Polyangiaceae bacterium]
MREVLLRLSLGCFWWLAACHAAPPAADTHAPAAPAAAKQAGYCERLQPLLDKAVRQARIGTELSCLDMPNVTGLGFYGPKSSGEEAALRDCFDQGTDYEALLHQGEAAFDLEIEDSFLEAKDAHAGMTLSSLVPWLPRIEGRVSSESQLSARVSIRDARFVTLVGVASKLQGQAGEQRCLEALCKDEYSYVQKALVGTPSVVLSVHDEKGNALDVNTPLGGVGFSTRKMQGGSHEITAEKPVTLAIARSTFRTPQTERLCDFCGKRGQACCKKNGPACDGGLGCIAERCEAVGAPGQPCDAESCSGGATCVEGRCELTCGGRGQPCCGAGTCAGKLKCRADPDNAVEHRVFAEDVLVEGHIFGTDEDRVFAASSCGTLRTRVRYAVTKLASGRGNCDKAWWFEPKNERDCRTAVHFDVSPFGAIRCRVEAFALAPPKPDVCL